MSIGGYDPNAYTSHYAVTVPQTFSLPVLQETVNRQEFGANEKCETCEHAFACMSGNIPDVLLVATTRAQQIEGATMPCIDDGKVKVVLQPNEGESLKELAGREAHRLEQERKLIEFLQQQKSQSQQLPKLEPHPTEYWYPTTTISTSVYVAPQPVTNGTDKQMSQQTAQPFTDNQVWFKKYGSF